MGGFDDATAERRRRGRFSDARRRLFRRRGDSAERPDGTLHGHDQMAEREGGIPAGFQWTMKDAQSNGEFPNNAFWDQESPIGWSFKRSMGRFGRRRRRHDELYY